MCWLVLIQLHSHECSYSPHFFPSLSLSLSPTHSHTSTHPPSLSLILTNMHSSSLSLFLSLREAALNDLEAYIYKVKNRLTEDEDALKAVGRINISYFKSVFQLIYLSSQFSMFLFIFIY